MNNDATSAQLCPFGPQIYKKRYVSMSGRTKRTDEEHTTRSEFGVCKSRGAWSRSSLNPSGHSPPPHGCRQMFSAGWPLCFRAAWWQRWSGHAVTRTWESGLNSRHSLLWSRVPSGLHLLQLISHLACVVRALCQTHRLWKNNLTGFNLPPPHATLSLFFLLHFSSVAFVLLWDEGNPFCLAAHGSFCESERADLRPPVRQSSADFGTFSVGIHFCLRPNSGFFGPLASFGYPPFSVFGGSKL